ncbi:MAG: hypothetical protein NTW21_17615 [Verrucomicrobia bacterium]|nr:hypothetical protein [Verrucomicrobiota bacterium]
MQHDPTHRRGLATLLLLLAASPATAQEAPAEHPAPKPALVTKPGQAAPRTPLIPRAPSRAEWTVRFTTDFSAAEDATAGREPAAAAIGQLRTARSIQFSKDSEAQAYRLRTQWSDGDSEDEWIVMGSHVAERAGHRGLYIVGSESATAQELGRSDFPELAWVELSHFRGLKSYKGKPAFMFSVPFDQKRLSGDQAQIMAFVRRSDASATPTKVFKPKVQEVVLYLDAVTQLPLEYNDGMTLRRYTFRQPSESRLQPPAQILTFLRARSEALRVRLTPPAGPGQP